jgi:hypothetical protein
MGQQAARPPAVCVKLTRSCDEAVAVARATPPTISGLGQWGWLNVSLDARFVAELDARD